jgi:hypothetical protein
VTENRTFDRIREEVARDLRPTTPLRPAWVGALVVVPLSLLLLGLLLALYGLRSDAGAIGLWPLWSPAALMVAAAYGIFYVSLVQRSPESTVSPVVWGSVALVAAALQLGGAHAARAAGATDPVGMPLASEALCSLRLAILGVPALLVALALLSRGFPLRPRIAGLLAGLGAGFLSEGIYRLYCDLSSPAHILPWHTGAVLVMGGAGFLVGLWWERRRMKAWIARRA